MGETTGGPRGLKHELRFFRGWLAWLFVVRLCPDALVFHVPAAVLGWAGYYAYDRRHEPHA